LRSLGSLSLVSDLGYCRSKSIGVHPGLAEGENELNRLAVKPRIQQACHFLKSCGKHKSGEGKYERMC
jgi:UDP-N-acetylglucosamine enolpyruvyl transferase